MERKHLLSLLSAGTVTVAAMGTLMLPSPARAGLIASEQFNYTLGGIDGKTGGGSTGWNNAWASPDSFGSTTDVGQVVSEFVGGDNRFGTGTNYLGTTGNAVKLQDLSSNNATYRTTREMTTTLGTNSDVVWTAFLSSAGAFDIADGTSNKQGRRTVMYYATSAGDQGNASDPRYRVTPANNVGSSPANPHGTPTTPSMGIGNPTGSTSSWADAGGGALAIDTPMLVITKISDWNALGGSTRTMKAWWLLESDVDNLLNDLSTPGEMTEAELDTLTRKATNTATLATPQASWLTLLLKGDHTRVWTIDEFRVGTGASPAAAQILNVVAPEPASLALFAASGLMLLPRRRRA